MFSTPIIKFLEWSGERSSERSSDQASARTSDRASDRAIERALEQTIERAIERASDRTIERASERAIERPCARSSDRDIARAIERSSDGKGEHTSSSRIPFDMLTRSLCSIVKKLIVLGYSRWLIMRTMYSYIKKDIFVRIPTSFFP